MATRMKLMVILTSIFTLTSQQANSCDVCGCSLGGNYFGILPLYNKNFVGLRWSQAKFYSYMDHQSENLPPEHSHDTYNKTELWGRYYVTNKLQIFGFLPYMYNQMDGTAQVVSTHGLGDITVMANYVLINTGEEKDKKFKHSLLLGGGVKLPSGEFKKEDNGKLINPNFQMGTGSVDFLVTSVYTLRYQKIGANLESGYKINTRNAQDYLFGNQFHFSSQLFYWQKIKSFSILPNAGLYYEQATPHKDGQIIQANTGGYALLAMTGLETYYKNFTLGVTYKHILAQHYNSDAIAEIEGKDRWTVSLTYNF